MAEVQRQRGADMPPSTPFIEFVMMQAQNILFMLGLIPTPDGRRVRPDIAGARLLIDQLGMIKEKTRGNLSADESSVLDQMLSRVRLTFVEVARSLGEDPDMDLSEALGDDGAEDLDEAAAPAPKAENRNAPASSATPPSTAASPITTGQSEPEESKKRFVKSYG